LCRMGRKVTLTVKSCIYCQLYKCKVIPKTLRTIY
jgi:hypothetical protein